MQDIIVIGGGASGMMAAGVAAEASASSVNVMLLEKNEKLGKKLHITGKGRCNITNNTDTMGLLQHVVTNPKFLQSAFHAMDSNTLMEFFESRGLSLKTERGNRVFPLSDNASDVTKTLDKYMYNNGVKVKLNCAVTRIDSKYGIFYVHTKEECYKTRAVVIATGGLSYPATGSTGDGYTFANKLSHTILQTYPSLVPLIVKEHWVGDLEGLSLRNVHCAVKLAGKTLYEETGEMLFTRNGVTGPIILRASAMLTDKLINKADNIVKTPAIVNIDLKPALTTEQLDSRILRDFAENKNRNFGNVLNELLPKRMIDTIISLTDIPADKKVHDITRAQRQVLISTLKGLLLTVIKTAGYKEAVITKGGVNVREINPSTLMSKKVAGLFFAGEVMDVDALTGGYNLQIAFSTGYLVGNSVVKFLGN